MRLKIVKEQADQDTLKDWREEDYMNKMNFNPLVMFVVIPTIVNRLPSIYGCCDASEYCNFS